MKHQLSPVCFFKLSRTVAGPYIALALLSALLGIPLILFGGEEARMLGIVYCLLPLVMAFWSLAILAGVTSLYNVLVRRLGGIRTNHGTES